MRHEAGVRPLGFEADQNVAASPGGRAEWKRETTHDGRPGDEARYAARRSGDSSNAKGNFVFDRELRYR